MSDEPAPDTPNKMRARRLGVVTPDSAIVFMREDCHVCRSEGFDARAQVKLSHGARSVIATLYHVTSDLLRHDEAGLSDTAWRRLGLHGGEMISVSHPAPLTSFATVRAKVFGKPLGEAATRAVIEDIVARRYSDIHLAAFVTACSTKPFSADEMTALTSAMVETGDRLSWDQSPIVDKHCVGGLPGNRTTPIVVAIVTALGLIMPKTSSRAITSPAGTADAMETLAPVDLDLAAMRRVVEREGGCIVWGGAVQLSPADDVMIRISRALDIDAEGPLVASVLAKKIAAGASHLVLDVPVGPTAKIRTEAAAESLSSSLMHVSKTFGLTTRVVHTDGRQPVGRGIGPALEARDVVSVLHGDAKAPADLRAKAVTLAGVLLEMAGSAAPGGGVDLAEAVLSDGRAWSKFQHICEAQGGMREPPTAVHTRPIPAPRDGRVQAIDNRRLAMAAKLAGAPDAKAAGVELHVRLGDAVEAGTPLFTLHTETPGELDYAIDYVVSEPDIIALTAP
ncbi:MAG: thymidine phosphorylase family protein [Pseudomonadota bacterium]